MKIGDKIWIYDDNNRVYVDDNGVRHSSPIYRKKFVEYNIVDETRVSWVLSGHYTHEDIPDWAKKNATKVKKTDANKSYWTSEEEVEKHCWVNDNRYKIVEKIRFCNDHDILKKIDELLSELK